MLKYRINTRQFTNQNNRLNIEELSLDELYADSIDEQLLLTCVTPDIAQVKTGDKLVCAVKKRMVESDYDFSRVHEFDFTPDIIVSNCCQQSNSFSAYVDKYFTLDVRNVSLTPIIDTNNGSTKNWYLYLYFRPTHFYEVYDRQKTICFKYYNDGGEEIFLTEGEFEYVNYSTLRITFGNAAHGNLSEAIEALFQSNGITKDSVLTDAFDGCVADISGFQFYRPDFFFDNKENLSIYFDRPMYDIKIGLSQNLETNLYQSDAIRQDFTEVKKKESISPIVDMERDVYHPIMVKKTRTNPAEVDYNPVRKIKFNFHFREHRGNDWVADADSYWNGTVIKNVGGGQRLTLMEYAGSPNYGFFGLSSILPNDYARTDDKSCQSDLLSYLNFTDNDVKYQKNRLSKSFIRLSFYDSMRPTEQRLLHYSTIYMNSSALFKRQVSGLDKEPYCSIDYNQNGTYKSTKSQLSGIKVSREPYDDLIVGKSFDDIEQYRLSSQITVTDKYSSTQSSEGFYLYLWRDGNDSVVPQDIYMKVDFNHAGYGRTIPFLMPYWDKEKWVDGNGNPMAGVPKIKTFQEIVDDWNPAPNATAMHDGEWGVGQFIKFSHIHFKYCYNTTLGYHVYYLDPEEYGYESLDFEDDAIVLNLYEAKIGNSNSVANN